jgi:toxin ParE1/3/4
MSYMLIFTNESQQDLREGFTWYEEKRAGLGIDFMLTIEATIRIIERNPFAYSLAPTNIPNIRRAIVFKFSYLIFYTIIQQSVIILSIVSSKQDAAVWKTRIGDV